jgi:hypothetical protein
MVVVLRVQGTRADLGSAPRFQSNFLIDLEKSIVFTSASPRCLDGGDIDLLHRHHGLKGTLGLSATNRKRIG